MRIYQGILLLSLLVFTSAWSPMSWLKSLKNTRRAQTKVTQKMTQETTEITRLTPLQQAAKNGDILPPPENFEDPFDSAYGFIFKSFRSKVLTKTHAQSEAFTHASGAIHDPRKMGFALIGDSGSGKTQILDSIEASFRLRANNQIGPKVNAHVVSINTAHPDFRKLEQFTKFIKELSDDFLNENGKLYDVRTIVFHIDDLKPFIGEKDKANGLFEVYMDLLRGLDSPPHKTVKIALEAKPSDAKVVLSESRYASMFNSIDVVGSRVVEDQLKIVQSHLPLLDPENVLGLNNETLGKLLNWVNRYAPGNGAVAKALNVISSAAAKQVAYLNDANVVLSDDVAEALKREIKALKHSLERAQGLNGAYAKELSEELPTRIKELKADLKVINDEYVQLEKIRGSIQKLWKEYYAIPNPPTSQAEIQQVEKIMVEIDALYRAGSTVSERRLAAELAHITDTKMADILRFTGRMSYNEFEKAVDQTLFGQPRLKAAILRGGKRALDVYSGKKDPDPVAPIFSIFAWGYSGGGKTEAYRLLQQLTDGAKQFKGAEYSEANDVKKLLGAPPGYVGYDNGGEITNQLNDSLRQAFNFDEVERGNKAWLDTIQQMHDPGEVTDAFGRTYRTNEAIITQTSNVVEEVPPGYNVIDKDSQTDLIMKHDPRFTKPYFSRIDEVVYVGKNDEYTNVMITRKFLRLLNDSSYMKDDLFIKVKMTEKAEENLVADVWNTTDGTGRDIKQAVQKYIENPIADAVQSGGQYVDQFSGQIRELSFKEGDMLELDFDEDLGGFILKVIEG